MGVGRLPKPTNLKILEGNPGKRSLNKNEPKPKPGIPRAPKRLSDEAKEEWRALAKALEPTQMLTQADAAVMEAFANERVNYRRAQAAVDRMGLFVKDGDGRTVINPAYRITEKSARLIKGYLGELGLSPASRVRLQSGAQEDIPDDDGLLD